MPFRPSRRIVWVTLSFLTVCGCARTPQYDLVIRHGTVYDGTGAKRVVQDVAVKTDRIIARGDLSHPGGNQEVDATGLAVAPGFIDMLNHSETALIADACRRPAGDGRRRVGCDNRSHLHPGRVCEDWRTRRACEGGLGIGGMYISHMRSEGDRLLEAIDETLTIAREAHIRS